jgi:hypothetical protein
MATYLVEVTGTFEFFVEASSEAEAMRLTESEDFDWSTWFEENRTAKETVE